MFKVILETQWKWARLPLLVATVVAFAIPVQSVQGLGGGGSRPHDVLFRMVESAVWYPLLAAAVGLLLAVTAWNPDHRQGHAYALSLPIPRWKYAMLRLGAGLVLLAAPVVGVTTGSFLASATATIPVGLTAYPLALSMRFTLAAVMAFTLFFAVAGSSSRTAGYILGVIALVVVVPVVSQMFGLQAEVVAPIFDRLTDWRGPLGVFGGRWMLIDV